MVVHGRPKTPKIQVFLGSPSPQGSYSPYILGDTTRPGHVTCVLVWSKSDRRRLRKTLHKQTDRQTDKQTDTTKIMVTWPWTNHFAKYHTDKCWLIATPKHRELCSYSTNRHARHTTVKAWTHKIASSHKTITNLQLYSLNSNPIQPTQTNPNPNLTL